MTSFRSPMNFDALVADIASRRRNYPDRHDSEAFEQRPPFPCDTPEYDEIASHPEFTAPSPWLTEGRRLGIRILSASAAAVIASLWLVWLALS